MLTIVATDDAAGREQLLRDRLRHPDGTPHAIWPVDTDIPDPSVFYTACFAVPHGDRAFLHFRHQREEEAGEEEQEQEQEQRANEERLAPLLFAYNRRNSNLKSNTPSSVTASRILAVAAAPYTLPHRGFAAPGPRWRQSDTILTGILVKTPPPPPPPLSTAEEEAPLPPPPPPTFVVDDVLVFRGARCPAASLAARATLLHQAIVNARRIPGRCCQIVPESHRRAPPMPEQQQQQQWLPEPWTPPYVAKVFQLRDLTAVRPSLNLRLNDWAATWDPPVAVAGSGVTADLLMDEDDEDEEEEEATTTRRRRRRRRAAPLVPMDLNPHRVGDPRMPLAELLVGRCPVYRGPAVFALQADPGMADIYRLFCLRDGADRRAFETALLRHNELRAQDADAEDGDAPLFQDHLQFYQLALVHSFELSVRLNVWFRHVPEQERFAWTLIGAPPAAAEALPPALRNEDGRRVLLFECVYDAARHRWIPQTQLPFAAAYRTVGAASLVAPRATLAPVRPPFFESPAGTRAAPDRRRGAFRDDGGRNKRPRFLTGVGGR